MATQLVKKINEFEELHQFSSLELCRMCEVPHSTISKMRKNDHYAIPAALKIISAIQRRGYYGEFKEMIIAFNNDMARRYNFTPYDFGPQLTNPKFERLYRSIEKSAEDNDTLIECFLAILFADNEYTLEQSKYSKHPRPYIDRGSKVHEFMVAEEPAKRNDSSQTEKD